MPFTLSYDALLRIQIGITGKSQPFSFELLLPVFAEKMHVSSTCISADSEQMTGRASGKLERTCFGLLRNAAPLKDLKTWFFSYIRLQQSEGMGLWHDSSRSKIIKS